MAGEQKQQPIDWLKAVILERMHANGFTREDVCVLAGISVPTFRTLMLQPVTAWDYSQRKAVLKALRIKIKELPEDVQLSIAQYLE
ncbi:MAG: hypothetical protein IJP98_02365 [Clostridia bacterium]|nr:hypothetical protein [Clostridia bacterium]